MPPVHQAIFSKVKFGRRFKPVRVQVFGCVKVVQSFLLRHYIIHTFGHRVDFFNKTVAGRLCKNWFSKDLVLIQWRIMCM